MTEELHTALKVFAASSGVPMNDIVIEAVIEYLNQTSNAAPNSASSST